MHRHNRVSRTSKPRYIFIKRAKYINMVARRVWEERGGGGREREREKKGQYRITIPSVLNPGDAYDKLQIRRSQPPSFQITFRQPLWKCVFCMHTERNIIERTNYELKLARTLIKNRKEYLISRHFLSCRFLLPPPSPHAHSSLLNFRRERFFEN